jgi:hypothetical protein
MISGSQTVSLSSGIEISTILDGICMAQPPLKLCCWGSVYAAGLDVKTARFAPGGEPIGAAGFTG